MTVTPTSSSSGGMQVSGLLTGFDTQAVVDKLMAAERLAGNKISDAQTSAQALGSAFTQLNGLMSALGDAATAVIPDPLMKTSLWQTAAATSSATSVASVTAGQSATPATLTFTVDQVAQAATSASGVITATNRSTALSSSPWSMAISVGGKTVPPVAIAANATLNDVAAAINARSDIGASASVVQVGTGAYRLQLVSNTTGAASTIAVDTSGSANPAPQGFDAFVTTAIGQDTKITVGQDVKDTNGNVVSSSYSVTSPNTAVTGLMDGVTINALTTGTTTVTVANDPNAIADKVQAMVDAANAALQNIRINSQPDPNLTKSTAGQTATNNSGLFIGNSTTMSLTQKLSDIFVGSGSNVPSMVGFNIDKDGAVSFDRTAFLSAYAKDPASVEKSVTGLAQQLSDASKSTTNSADGALTVAIQGQNALIQDYTNQMKDFNDRMTAKQDLLNQQYQALDAMLSQLKSQGDWLTGQLATLNSSSSK